MTVKESRKNARGGRPSEPQDTEDEGDHGSQSQSHPEVSHPVVEGGHGHSVR